MANTITSPNMNMPIPNPGVDSGPDWANNLNSSLGIVDIHNHSPGFGVQITASGINVNSDLPFNVNNAVTLRTVRFSPQVSVLALATDIGCIYEVGVDLYYNDGAGNQVRLTQGGGVAGSPGSISNLTSPASASYVAGNETFVWQSDASTPANMDAASYILRNLSASSKGLTLSPPAAMGADFSITLPTLPLSQSFVTIDSTGAMAAPVVYPLVAAGIANQTITAAKIVDATITTAQIASATILASNIAAGVIPGTQSHSFTSSGTWTAPAGVTWAVVKLLGGGGGGGGGFVGGASTGAGGGGGSGAQPQVFLIDVTPATVYTVTVGAGGAGGTNAPTDGANGGISSITESGVIYAKVFGGLKGLRGNSTTLGAGGGAGPVKGTIYCAGGNGGANTGSITSVNGEDSPYASGGASGGSVLGGGGGGAGLSAGGAGGAAGGGHNGVAGAANSGAGGGGGGEQAAGGAGGSGLAEIVWIAP